MGDVESALAAPVSLQPVMINRTPKPFWRELCFLLSQRLDHRLQPKSILSIALMLTFFFRLFLFPLPYLFFFPFTFLPWRYFEGDREVTPVTEFALLEIIDTLEREDRVDYYTEYSVFQNIMSTGIRFFIIRGYP